MPKGIKKRTAATVRAEMEKQVAAINDMRTALRKAKEDYENKVRQMRDDLKAKEKRLGELQIEFRQLMQALRNRLLALRDYEKQLAEKIEKAKAKKTPNVMVLVTQRQYMECFIEYWMPIRKRRPDKPLTWMNDAELDKLTALNAAINNGETVETFRRRFHDLTEQEKAAEQVIEHMIYMGERDTEKLADTRAHLDEIKAAQKDAAEKLEMIEKIMNGTYVQDMLSNVFDRKRSEIVPNGYYNANTGVRRR